MEIPTPEIDAEGMRIGVVVSRYHESITSALAEGARDAFIRGGGDPDDLFFVAAPGAFELPVLAASFAEDANVDAVVVLGCVVTGETRHDEYIASAVAAACARLSVESGVPVGFGLLTVATLEQARERAGGSKGNKGAEAMAAAIGAAHAVNSIREIDDGVWEPDEEPDWSADDDDGASR